MKSGEKKAIRFVCNIVFVIYMILIFYFVLVSERYGRQTGYLEYQYNLKPFREIHRFIVYRHSMTMESFITNLIGNIFAFSPFGALIPIVGKKKKGIFRVAFATLCFSLSIELMQLVFKLGVFDVDDLMLNTLGGVIGYLCYRLLRRICYVS